MSNYQQELIIHFIIFQMQNEFIPSSKTEHLLMKLKTLPIELPSSRGTHKSRFKNPNIRINSKKLPGDFFTPTLIRTKSQYEETQNPNSFKNSTLLQKREIFQETSYFGFNHNPSVQQPKTTLKKYRQIKSLPRRKKSSTEISQNINFKSETCKKGSTQNQNNQLFKITFSKEIKAKKNQQQCLSTRKIKEKGNSTKKKIFEKIQQPSIKSKQIFKYGLNISKTLDNYSPSKFITKEKVLSPVLTKRMNNNEPSIRMKRVHHGTKDKLLPAIYSQRLFRGQKAVVK